MSSSLLMLLSHNHTHTHTESTGSTHSTHCTQLQFCNYLSGVVVKWCPKCMLSALLHYQSLGNNKTIYRSYLATYPVVAIVHGLNGQPWLELDWQTGLSISASACTVNDVRWKWNTRRLIELGVEVRVAYSELSQLKRSRWWVFQTSCTISNDDVSSEDNEWTLCRSL